MTMLDLSLDMPFLGFLDRASPSQGQCIVFRISAPKPGENTWRNEGLGVISLSAERKADKALPLWAAPQPPTVL